MRTVLAALLVVAVSAFTLRASRAGDPAPTTEHEIRLTGLTPDTRYFYAVEDDTHILAGGDAGHFFDTHPIAGTTKSTRVWILGDSGTGSPSNPNARQVADAYKTSPLFAHPDVWLMLGDNAYGSGTDAEYQQAVFDTYPGLLRDTVLWSTLGNHETYDDPDNPPSFDIFTLPRNAEAGGVASPCASPRSPRTATASFTKTRSPRRRGESSPTSRRKAWRTKFP